MRPRIAPLDLSSDLDRLARLYSAVFAEPPWNAGPDEMADFMRRLPTEARAGAGGFGAWSTDELIGFAYAVPTPTPFPAGRAYDRVAQVTDVDRLVGCWEVMELAVDPAQRGRGVASALLDALLDEYSPAWLLTATDAPAVQFYDRRSDFRRTGQGEGLVVYASTYPAASGV
ncbi:GNAT family N-acetyltransferase [Nocardioides potassii]|uniref:GNAT family N-acetyltransferase n=1 Tax=Nocardioides potassii TaxID=2911371 RepID=UPI0035585964